MGDQPYVTIRSRRPHDGNSMSSADSTYGSSSGQSPRMATHDISRVSYHVKHLDSFAQTLEDSANRAFPNRGRSSQRYKKVQALLLHWGSDDLFVLPELEDLERCLREDYAYDTEIFPIPSENSHLELMMQVGKLIKDHEAQDTLFLVYYGGHARIDESRQSTWCATRNPDSPWLQWSAIQTLLERSASDCLIFLDCCAGAASATFPNGNSITETISASSWDAIAPDPGRYSFTNALIEVMQEWRMRTFSAAMLHAEVLARLKHPRPITINGKLFEARSTPVHFMMTSNHKAPSIEISRIVPPEARPPSPPQDASVENDGPPEVTGGRGPRAPVSAEPNEDTPHVMISLALEDDQQLDLNAWEQWLSSFPALAKYVKVQGVYKSHSTLLLVSMPVMIWDLLPEDHATSFVAFIRSNNLMTQKGRKTEVEVTVPASTTRQQQIQTQPSRSQPRPPSIASFFSGTTYPTMITNQQRKGRRTVFGILPEPPKFSQHVETLLQQYYQQEPLPDDDQKSFVASNLGIELWHVEAWFHHQRERDVVSQQFQNLRMDDAAPQSSHGAQMILPHHLHRITEILPLSRILLIDLRPPADFERSHIRGAINLRAPLKFVKDAPLDLIERAFPDAASRQKFGQWQSTTCIAVYSRAVDSTWECPLADLLYQKFKSWGWLGRCFVLKGHYREFSVSYSASLAGSRNPRSIINVAHDDPRTSESTQDLAYETLLGQIDSEEGRLNPSAPGPTASSDRARAATQHEQNLETEFRRRVPDLYRKALDVGASSSPAAPLPPSSGPGFGQSDPDDDPSLPPATRVCSDGSGEASSTSTTIPSSSLLRTPDVTTKLHLVEYLDRGLAHIRQGLPDSQISCPSPVASATARTKNTTTTTSLSPGLSKLAADGYFDAYPPSSTSLPPPPAPAPSATMTTTTGPCPSDDSYVKISMGDALQLGDPGASGTTGTTGTSITTAAAAAAATATPAAASKDGTRDVAVGYGDETPRRGRGGFLNKVLRRA
ncbi:hypothetical protein Cob_v008567 [Colletotrichum orbiculare MAFF 240422]|uniref:Tyrosine-protein phosphatase non-receptor type 6 n=1 Tax=Colletotrichum orbiculare (strain 104-T / ATCC 96160 / CBS 514.97 / LARS 414 / MAFF 240422) TaxID=1213857 RepID=A0A484FL01_COLOR|nr:hypothetical protein Cob_v008567 [Colletotrichum orbiculare MAFF 240422]